MPRSYEILSGLEQIANEAFWFAVAWHIVIGVVLLALARGWRPAPRLVALSLSAPLASVGVLAWAFGNPFNGAVFSVLAITLALLAWRAPSDEATPKPLASLLGGVMIAFAWLYPHFLVGRDDLAYLYGSPMGLIPCPTLSLVIGFALLGYSPGKRAWPLVVAGAGIFYALFGSLVLGVAMDLVLFLGAVGLATQTLLKTSPTLRAIRH